LAGSRERERRRARERFERQQQERRERQRKIRQRLFIGLAVVCVLGLVGGLTAAFVGGSTPAAPKPKATASASPSASASASASASTSAAAVAEPATHCTYTTSGVAAAAKKVSVPPAAPNYKATYTASINTSAGTIKMDLLNSKATCTVNSFVHLATAGYFNASQCHRIVNSAGLYVLQCGDPLATAATKLTCSTAGNAPGTGGPGYEFASENLPAGASSAGTVTYPAGSVAMANSGSATSNGSQFFLVFKNSTLGPDYTPFATITSGLDILQKVANAGTSCTYTDAGGGVPKEKVVINSVTIKQT
jgi:peptidyl-prolyl cis-trans isomerase B (cyclophilin B)